MSTDDRKLIEKLLLDAVDEQRRSRRWRIFFRCLFFCWLFALMVLLFRPDADLKSLPRHYVALVDVKGAIAADGEASASNVVVGLRKAYKDTKVQGIILRINSPGGSPVQAGYIYDEINRLRESRPDLKVYAVITDMGASAAYYIAAAADEIYASPSSIVGSIGAFMAGFGVEEAMKKLGVTRRFYGSGKHKALTDPFQPEDQLAAQHLRSLVASVHEQFIASVKAGRGERLKDHPDLFTGLVWTGNQAMDLGLIDGLGSPGFVAREQIGVEDVVDFTVKRGFVERFARQLGAGMSNSLTETLGLGAGVIR
ncbi:MAG: S49 family peptidase [Kistimonas sp.]|nr:S49 family peptidase [Kistimonas sp.]